MTTQRLRIEMQTRLLRISEDRFETMLRVELGNLRTSIYLERSNFPPETDVRIMFWYDQRKSGISNKQIPDFTEISDDKRIFANDIITDNEWNYRTWTRFLKTDSVQGASCYFLLANPSSEFIFPGVVAVVPIFGN